MRVRACAFEGLKRESCFVCRLLPSYGGSDKSGGRETKGFQKTGDEVASVELNPCTFDNPAHSHTTHTHTDELSTLSHGAW